MIVLDWSHIWDVFKSRWVLWFALIGIVAFRFLLDYFFKRLKVWLKERRWEKISKDSEFSRRIPFKIKRIVFDRDEGKCVKCGETKNLHFDHDLPFAKGGTSLTAKNVRLLCMKHNLQKSDKIE